MKLRKLAGGTSGRRVAAVVYDTPSGPVCPVTKELRGFAATRGADVRGLNQRFTAYAQGDPLSREIFHEANKENGIWEFVKGDLRAFCFIEDQGLVVLSCVLLKKGQKADKAAVAGAVRLRDEYQKEKAKKNVPWEKPE